MTQPLILDLAQLLSRVAERTPERLRENVVDPPTVRLGPREDILED